MQRRNLLLGAFAVLGVGGWVLTNQMGGPTSTPLAGAANANTSNVSDVDTSGVTEMVLGSEDAPVTIIEYASYTCPHCAAFHQGPFKQIKANYIDTGKVRFIYREVYFDRPGLWASMVARCGGAEKHFGIADLIYKGQDTWARAGEPAAIVDELMKIGRLAGIDNETLSACLQDADQAQMLAAWEAQNRAADNVTSTPSFVINGRNHSNMSYADFAEIIDAELGS